MGCSWKKEVKREGDRSGTARDRLALVGIEDEVLAEAVADELDELPLAYRFDVKARSAITFPPLEEHISRVGITFYRRDSQGPS